ncbi:MAG: hypothetical protein LC808_32655 [Actinobacteria bacterium]|nr:hypothetical protein [Actinomycetota bacterium]
MDVLTGFLVAAAGPVVSALFFLLWLYDPEEVPPWSVVLEDLRAFKAVVRIRRIGRSALDQMLDEARRRASR